MHILYYICLDCFNDYVFLIEVNTGSYLRGGGGGVEGAFLVGGGRSLYYMCLDCFNGYIFLVEVNTGISEISGISEKVGGGGGGGGG